MGLVVDNLRDGLDGVLHLFLYGPSPLWQSPLSHSLSFEQEWPLGYYVASLASCSPVSLYWKAAKRQLARKMRRLCYPASTAVKKGRGFAR